MPRRTKLTSQRMLVIQKALRAGSTRKAAAAVAGVGESTFYDWMRAGANDEGSNLARQLVVVVEAAEGEAELRAATTINEAIDKGDWKAAAWWLERRRRQEWGRPQPIPVAQPEQEKTPQTFAELVRMASQSD
jgi:transposase-like protein